MDRRTGLVIVAAVVAIGVAAAAWFWPSAQSTEAPRGAPAHETVEAARVELADGGRRRHQLPEDAMLEVTVRAQGAGLVSAGEVRAYEMQPEPGHRLSFSEAKIAPITRGVAQLKVAGTIYVVAARVDGYAPAYQRVLTEMNQTSRVEIEVQRGVELKVRVIGAVGRAPVAQAEVEVREHESALPMERGWPAAERTVAKSDGQGRVSFSGLVPGRAEVTARATGFSEAQVDVRLPAADELEIALAPPSVIEGMVVDAQETPVEGAEVHALGENDLAALRAALRGETSTVTTNASGGFRIEVKPGSYSVSGRKWALVGRVGPLTIAAGEDKHEVIVRLGPAASIAGKIVAKTTRAPIEHADVSIHEDRSLAEVGSSKTDSTGAYLLEALPPGVYRMHVWASGFTSQTRDEVRLGAGKRSFDFELVAQCAVEGVVLDASRRPVAGATVHANESFASVTTEAGGRYLIKDVDPGKVRVVASLDQPRFAAHGEVEVKEGETAHLDLTADPTGALAGHVRAKGGGPLQKPAIIEVSQGRVEWQLKVAADGAFRMELPAASYKAGAHYEGDAAEGEETVEIAAGGTTSHDFTLSASGDALLEGVVLEPGGSASARAMVTVKSADPSEEFEEREFTDVQGRFVIHQPETRVQGPLEVRAEHEARSAVVTGVEVGTRGLSVRLNPAASLKGHVKAGELIKQLTVSVDVPSFSTVTAHFPGARFELQEVPAGSARVVASDGPFRSGEATVELKAGVTSEVEIVLAGTGRIIGRLSEAGHTGAEKPFACEARVYDSADFVRMADCDGERRIEIDGLPPGDYAAELMCGEGNTRRTVTVQVGQTVDLGEVVMDGYTTEPGRIGVTMEQRESAVFVTELAHNGPAATAGLEAGDQIMAIDGLPVSRTEDVVKYVPGAPGTSVSVTIRRTGREQVIQIVRAK
jgi:hypothetical protein